ncbi:arsenic resistance N-acetyltransferase ArsN2 [Neorhizobium sp. T786]|uniref:arsenic resistance N-acetyltransferase ArsN2 n=1 Tax=Pseudorhizobium xiangyangii TaxID=2883104 RepID=UPI001D001784|nr:arsenic resistance N-acetyltransferase ArsN2 [Neorhizobium xiangyangii]MCB5205301.1 arsenic resistance N-acetyltransferase ArsN2 [Neorhizobium xiangyangii]
MIVVKLEPVTASDIGLSAALSEADLPTEDIGDPGRSFFRGTDTSGSTVGYSGVEDCGNFALLRSVVVLPGHRGKALGKLLAEATLETISPGSQVYLATTSAAPFFAALGFVAVDRAEVPMAILSTRQLSGICPASAIIMKLGRPPT